MTVLSERHENGDAGKDVVRAAVEGGTVARSRKGHRPR